MRILDNILYLDFAEMVACRIPKGTIDAAKNRQSAGWQFINDPADRRKVLIAYEPLADKYKVLIQVQYGDPYQYYSTVGIKKLLKKDYAALNYYRTYRLTPTEGLPEEHIGKYVTAAEWLNMLLDFNKNNPKKVVSALGLDGKRAFYDACVAIIKAEKVDLPYNYARLLDKVRKYEDDGYKCLVSKKFGNANSEKISADAAEWLLAYYSQFTKPTVEQTWMAYNHIATKRGWEVLKHHESIRVFLYREGNEQVWYAPRHGQHKANERFGIQHRTITASHADALWYSDGTGLNFFANDSKQQRMYYVLDSYSEVILGWDVQPTESETVVYNAAKKALVFANAKPHEWRYDNGGAHGKLKPFFDKVARLHFACEPYNGKSKPIESVNLRLQRYMHKQWWFFSGQNRGAKMEDSQYNDYQLYALRNELPTMAEVLKVVAHDVNEWNNAPHPITGIARIEMYNQSLKKGNQLTLDDMVAAFWSITSQPVTYNTGGIKIQIGKDKYHYEVLTDTNMPCLDFRRKHIGTRFYVKYDPSDMSYVWLYEQHASGLQFVTEARTKPATHLATIDHVDGELAQIRERQALKKQEIAQRKQRTTAIQEATGITPDAIVQKQRTKLNQLSYAEHLRTTDLAAVSLYGGDDDDDSPLQYLEMT